MESVLTKLASGKLSTCAAITLMFTYTILLDRDFTCTCKPQGFQCRLYVSLPVCIITLLILWTDASFQRVCRFVCSCSSRSCRPNTCSIACFFFHHILMPLLVGLLWVAFVFLDGDLYVCCQNGNSEQQLACKAAGKIMDKEQGTIADLKDTSRVIGGFTLFGIILVAFLLPFSRTLRKCCEGNSRCSDDRFLYEKLILEEQDNMLREILRRSARDQLTVEVEDRIRGEHWEECFDVAVDLINASTNPTAAEERR